MATTPAMTPAMTSSARTGITQRRLDRWVSAAVGADGDAAVSIGAGVVDNVVVAGAVVATTSGRVDADDPARG